MPRQSDSKAMGTQFYHSQFSNNVQYVSDAGPLPSTQSQPAPPQPTAAAPKKKHFCPTCDRAFTTSGHLARHSRVHTGERNHKCPFPGCETRCSRQDNLQQHYRIHLSPGSRRSSTRSAIARAMNGGSGSAASRRGSTVSAAGSPPAGPPPLSAPPALEPARGYSMSTPPDSPPPLAQATLPATSHQPPDSASSRSSSSPDISYSPMSPHHPHLVPMNSHSMSLQHSQPYSYRSGTTTYQEQSQGAGFTYVHTTPISHSSGMSYHSSNSNYDHHSLPHINTSSPMQHHQDPNSPSSPSTTHASSRHSISHISHPQSSYPHQSQHSAHGHSSASPPSPSSVSSHASGPATPSYPVYADDAQAYHNSGLVLEHGPDQPALAGGHISAQGHLVHPSYSPTLPVRFDSPPPILAPIQDERVRGGGERGQQQLQSSGQGSPYLHHPQPIGSDYQYHPSLGLSHGAWKTDSGMRSKTMVQ